MYGLDWDDNVSDLDIELYCFKTGRKEDEGGLGKYNHMRNAIDLLWNYKGSHTPFIWTPWSERILKLYCDKDILCLGGGASSGKSHIMAAMAWVEYLSSPTDTMCLISSTTIEGAKMRIYRSIQELHRDEFPCKMLVNGVIKGIRSSGSGYTEASGIRIIPCNGQGDPKNKFIGIKASNMRLFLDELSDLPMGVIDAWANLRNNARGSQPKMVSASNPQSRLDPFGVLATPKEGWESIDMERSEFWDTEMGGVYVRFDTTRNPRITEGRDDWNFYPSQSQVDDAIRDMGGDSALFKRFYRGIFADDLEDGAMMSIKEFDEAKAQCDPIWGSTPLEYFAALDPAFTQGGDRAIMVIGKAGINAEGRYVACITDYVHITKDIGDGDESFNRMLCRKVRDTLNEFGIPTKNFIFDITGCAPLADLLVDSIGRGFQTLSFGGKASTNLVPYTNGKRFCDLYDNKVTELWFFIKALLSSKQLYGLSRDAVSEFISRRCKSRGNMQVIETKAEMKKRLNKSPDIADAVVVFCHLIRTISSGRFGANTKMVYSKTGLTPSTVDVVGGVGKDIASNLNSQIDLLKGMLYD